MSDDALAGMSLKERDKMFWDLYPDMVRVPKSKDKQAALKRFISRSPVSSAFIEESRNEGCSLMEGLVDHPDGLRIIEEGVDLESRYTGLGVYNESLYDQQGRKKEFLEWRRTFEKDVARNFQDMMGVMRGVMKNKSQTPVLCVDVFYDRQATSDRRGQASYNRGNAFVEEKIHMSMDRSDFWQNMARMAHELTHERQQEMLVDIRRNPDMWQDMYRQNPNSGLVDQMRAAFGMDERFYIEHREDDILYRMQPNETQAYAVDSILCRYGYLSYQRKGDLLLEKAEYDAAAQAYGESLRKMFQETPLKAGDGFLKDLSFRQEKDLRDIQKSLRRLMESPGQLSERTQRDARYYLETFNQEPVFPVTTCNGR
jgi:hypothetical protein